MSTTNEEPGVKQDPEESHPTQSNQHDNQPHQQTGPKPFNSSGPKRGGNRNFNNRRQPFHGNFGRGGGNGGGGGRDGDFKPRRMQGGPPDHQRAGDKLQEKLAAIAGPTFDLPQVDTTEKKFSSRTRLYVGNIGNEVDEEELRELFGPYGETSEYFINKEKNFAFVRVDFRANAEKAKRELDGVLFKGKNIRIRFAPNNSTIKVKNLTHFVSNELLHASFQIFGEVERAYVIVDDRGKTTGEGVVEFARKGCALNAVRRCSEGCFFLTSSLRPCIVESYEPIDDSDGFSDRSVPRKSGDFLKAREVGPRFAESNTFEDEYGARWKQVFELHAQKELALKKEFEMEKEKLEAQMEFARYEHETELLRDQLRAREMDRDQRKHEWEMKERMAEEQRQRNDEQMRRQQEEMENRISNQEEEMRRRQQENNLFMQAHQLTNMLDQQEQAYDQPNTFEMKNENLNNMSNLNNMNTNNMEPNKPFFQKRNNRFDGRGDMGPNGPRNGGGRGGHWGNNDNRRDDFQHKRRRF